MLDGTTAEIRERKALRINPAKTCQPIGAMYAALGVNKCMPHSHGSQGCCAYHRSHLTRTYKEPVVATTSSFTEGASVFGGLANLQTALDNIFTIYNPDIVAVHTTCLSEVIGDDIPMIIKKSIESGKIPEGKTVIHANTPSFAGSHVTGYANQLEAFVKYLSESTVEEKKNVINLFPGFVDPSDMREIKRLASLVGVEFIMATDTSDVLDSPADGSYHMYPDGGTKIAELKAMGDSFLSLGLGPTGTEAGTKALEKKCNVPFKTLALPIGVSATDEFVDALRLAGDTSVPTELEYERGRLVDMISDMSQYLHNKKVAIFGDPDHLDSMVRFLVEIGMEPAIVITGTPGKKWERQMKELLPNAEVRAFSDMHYMHQWMKNNSVDLLIGNTYGKLVAKAENIPFVRFGFPILDRVGHRAFPFVGYVGAMRLIEKITDQFFDKRDREDPDHETELIF
ncbi:nitrogenase molybdenum-iron protein subunit beta [Pelagicoccus sp. SDUM812003]|uniref:nitrogenase molybdenum-iron protein subunit beta n=1 Tax=Pelagicoccus sp. SDUM812003 TaxID=3041267 RepID=UPI00280ED77A|nr:nitrogenase molybdenum-iron protein subunit beta [Pelagicoccus sp. SDUM812003]MDQ8203641.1 nitrogenase molybdenum-iron protein subunit beta [Pelagicoccus sp. SDUM812003]